MQTRITARHFNASPRLREHAAERLAKLERFYDGITNAHVVLTNTRDQAAGRYAEITLTVKRQHLKAEDTAPTYEQAIDNCVERLRRQILRYKGKLKSTDKDVHR